MQVKRFFAADMRQAMKLIRDELGADAAIIGNRRIAGGVELTAALDYKLFNEGRPGVVLGRDHWLYSDEEFNPAVNEDQNLQGNYALVEGVRQKLKAQGSAIFKNQVTPAIDPANYQQQ